MSDKSKGIVLAFTRGKEIVNVFNWDSVLVFKSGTKVVRADGDDVEINTIEATPVGSGAGFWIGTQKPQEVLVEIAKAVASASSQAGGARQSTNLVTVDLGPAEQPMARIVRKNADYDPI